MKGMVRITLKVLKLALTGVLVLAVFVLGYWVHGWLSPAPQPPAPDDSQQQTTEATAQRWTCSMHPAIDEPKPGFCPLCNMPLIRIETTVVDSEGPPRFTTTEAALALMELRTSPVTRRFVTIEVRMVGKVAYDETGVREITAWVGGRLDRLYVDYTGINVAEGDHMVYLYSPELLGAQEELLQALKAAREPRRRELAILKEITQATLISARDKLRLMGLTAEQIAELEQRGEPVEHVTIYAPIGGTVIRKHAQEGMYVKTGTRIYTIADLSMLWVQLDAYESDLMWLRYGQQVTFTAEAYPGETFAGRIALIYPVLDASTRTVKVRVNVPNPEGKLKPEMFVHGLVRAQVATGGRVMAAELAGKWIGPMHPEIVKDAPGACDVCGMPLVRPEDLGYMVADVDTVEKPLVMPVTAALVTGKRAVVYIEVPDQEQPTFEGREVVLGPRAGDYYIVRSGLNEGDLVVTYGNFKIDSALQIQAKPSMMAPKGGAAPAEHHHGAGQ